MTKMIIASGGAALVDAVRGSWSSDTSYCPEAWSAQNPASGQCAVTALVVQDRLGGEIARATSHDGISHFWNRVNGEDLDLTLEQFAKLPVWMAAPEVVSRDYILASDDTRCRYEKLRGKVSLVLEFE